jgi:nucleoside-diphosphate-sugar epimerase
MKILITGSSGFIGQNLLKTLTKKNTDEIYGLDFCPIEYLKDKYIHITADIGSDDWIKQLPTDIETVIHLAQSKLYRSFPEGAADMVRVNIGVTFKLLEWSRKNCVKKFLFASTGNVYKPRKKILKETDSCQPNSMYAATKLSGENLVSQYGTFFQTIILRIFSVYGPGQTDMIIPSIIKYIKIGKEILLAQGVGLCFTPIHVSDCVEIIKRLINSTKLKHCEHFNLAGNEIISLSDIIQKVSTVLKKVPNIRYTNDKPKYLQGSNANICKALKYQPVISFDEGILKTIQEIG